MLLRPGLLAFGTLVAPVFSLQFKYASVQQCAPSLLLTFSELTSPVSRAPASLTILPFNSSTIAVPLQNTNFSNGIALSPLPFVAGSEFIVSLNDASGNSLINNSGIFTVLPSPNNNSTCIPEPNRQPTFFTMASPVVSQCRNFTINYNTTVSSKAPSVRLYNPSGPSLLLNTTSDDPISGVATYVMAFSFGRGITLVMDNEKGTTASTPLLLVGGDSSSPTNCLPADIAVSTNSTPASSSRIIAISAAIIGAVAALFGVCLVIFIFISRYHRRRRRNIQLVRIDSPETDSYDEKRAVPGMIVLDSPLPTRFDNDSVFNLSPEKGYYDRNSLLSWSQAIPEDQRDLARSQAKNLPNLVNRLSDPIVLGSPTVPQPALLQSSTIARSLSGRHLRAPPDVPADLNSRAWSPVSVVSFYPSMCETDRHGGTSINGRSVGLPTSPRDGLKPIISISRATSKRSNASSQEWYGTVQ